MAALSRGEKTHKTDKSVESVQKKLNQLQSMRCATCSTEGETILKNCLEMLSNYQSTFETLRKQP